MSQTAARRAPAIWPVPSRLACRPAIRPQPNKAILIIILPKLLETQADLGRLHISSGIAVRVAGAAPDYLSHRKCCRSLVNRECRTGSSLARVAASRTVTQMNDTNKAAIADRITITSRLGLDLRSGS